MRAIRAVSLIQHYLPSSTVYEASGRHYFS